MSASSTSTVAAFSNLSYDDLLKLYVTTNDELEKHKKEQRATICNLNAGSDLSLLSNAKISELVIKNVPKGTYDLIDVTTLNSYRFNSCEEGVKTRKITLMRHKNLSLLINVPSSFLNPIFKANSVYLTMLSHPTIKDHLLSSTNEDAAQKKRAETQIKAAYAQYKTITIYIAESCEQDAICEIQSGSEIVTCSMERGKAVRNFLGLHK